MHERLTGIKTADGVMDTFVAHPQTGGPFPAVIVFMDIWGVREELYDIARRVAGAGYYCVVPDLYYRQGKVRFEFKNENGETITSARLDPQSRGSVHAQMERLTNKMAIDDTASILAFMNEGEPVRGGGMGAIGYCMGGRLVLCAAGAFPERFIASAAIHGTRMLEDFEVHGNSPLRLAHRFRGELYCGFAERDQHMPVKKIEQMDAILNASPVRYQSLFHAGATHGYALPDRDVYDKQAAELDWANILAMFHRQIPPGSP